MSIYAHFDIEADGQSPATSNMISIAIVFTNENGKIVDELLVDLQPRLGFPGDKNTKLWWQHKDRIDEYTRIMKSGINPIDAMKLINDKVESILKMDSIKKIKWVARPSAYDWMWLKYYSDMYRLHNTDAIDLGFSAICTSTMRNIWMAQNGVSGSVESEKIFKEWVKNDNLQMTHNALDDARFQAKIFHVLQEKLSSRI